MKIIALCLSLLFITTIGHAQAEMPNYKNAAAKFKQYYNNNQPDSLYNLFSPEVKAAMTPEVLKQTFTQMHAQLGNLKQTTFIKYVSSAGLYKADYDKMTFMLSLSLNGLNQINGFYFNEYKPESASPAAVTKAATVLTEMKTSAAAAQQTPISDPTLTEAPFVVKTLGGTLSGTLTTPKDFSGKIPVVMIIPGSGPTDRDGNSALGVNTNTYKDIAEALGKAGIASLRYDKRGVGQSSRGGKEEDSRFNDNVNDASALLLKLKEDTRFSKFIILGHSEGSLVGMLTAYSEPLNGFISVDGAGQNADKIIVEQLTKTAPPSVVDEFKTIADSLRKGKTVPRVDPALYSIARPTLQKYLMSWMYYPPAVVIHKIKIPILIIHGTTDLQVSVSDAERLKKGRSEATLKIIEGMNHVLKEAPLDREKNLATYKDPNLPLKPEFVTAVVDFIKALK